MRIEALTNVRVEERFPTRADYQSLENQSCREIVMNNNDELSSEGNLYGIIAYDGLKIIGMGCIVGDGVSYFFIKDIIVHPKYLNQGVGRLIMEHIERYFESMAIQYAYIGLIAAKGTQEFYKKFGFLERKNKCQGMFKILFEQN